jgi:hypothetical protein
MSAEGCREFSHVSIATLLANSEAIVRERYSKRIPERHTAFENAARATWKKGLTCGAFGPSSERDIPSSI